MIERKRIQGISFRDGYSGKIFVLGRTGKKLIQQTGSGG